MTRIKLNLYGIIGLFICSVILTYASPMIWAALPSVSLTIKAGTVPDISGTLLAIAFFIGALAVVHGTQLPRGK